MSQEQRQVQRVAVSLPIQLIFGPQITLNGQIKDLTLKSAFVKVKNSIYMEPNDELGFAIADSLSATQGDIQGMARISRITVGEGIAIYFTKIDEGSSARLQQLIGTV